MPKYLNAKLAYLLSTCHKFTDSFFASMSKQFESKKILATRYYFTFFINLHEPTQTNYFSIKDVFFKFANSEDIVLVEALQYHNNNILSWEMTQLYENVKDKDLTLNIYQMVALYTIASLIKVYKDEGFKYIFIPVVISYGRSKNLLHQTSLIIDYANSTFIYYEPYGNYTKYDKSYKECICDLFHIFDGLNLFDGKVKCVSYHDLFKFDKGIQQIILEKNNARGVEFKKEYDSVMEKIKTNFPSIDIEPTYTMAKFDKKDVTFKILDLLFNIDTVEIYNPNKLEIYTELLNEVLKIYCCYNSKTCVTITLVEMNYFFSNATLDENGIRDKIQDLYSQFNIDNPNPVLMVKLNNLINIFKNSADIISTVENNVHAFEICKKLYS